MSINPVEIPTGAVRYNTDSNKMEVYIGSTWMEVAVSSPNLGDSQSPAGTRGAFMGGFRDTPVNNTTFDTIDYITIPTAGAIFPHDIATPPREWAERSYNIVRWTEMPKGGHFAAMEEPEMLVDDIRGFFRQFRG